MANLATLSKKQRAALDELCEALDAASRDEGNEPTERIETAANRVARAFGWLGPSHFRPEGVP